MRAAPRRLRMLGSGLRASARGSDALHVMPTWGWRVDTTGSYHNTRETRHMSRPDIKLLIVCMRTSSGTSDAL